MNNTKCDIALYGLGVMGSSLAKNMIHHQFKVAAFSKSEEERQRFVVEGYEDHYIVCQTENEMLDQLSKPRIIFLMITAGKPVDSVIDALCPMLDEGDIVIDGGNSNYHDTTRRYNDLKEKGIHYLGVGVSGGEKGALEGPSMMAGGSLTGWNYTRNILQTIAAHDGDIPCCTYIAKEGAGHYVKMVHNGIEYAILQLIAETYYIFKEGLHLPHDEITSIFQSWKDSELNSYLIDISIKVLEKYDEDGTPLVEKILDVAGQKGTGKWTILDGIERGVYIPTIYEAVNARNVSANKEVRVRGKQILSTTATQLQIQDYANTLKDTLLLGIIASYAQGIALIAKASQDNDWDIDFGGLVSVWRDGCIIRSELLKQVRLGVQESNDNLMLSETFRYITKLEPSLRSVVTSTMNSGLAIPGITSVLNYYDSFRMAQMPVNFIQALRDCFGAHTYQRIDQEGTFHTEWEK